jgi:hypothetical protein
MAMWVSIYRRTVSYTAVFALVHGRKPVAWQIPHLRDKMSAVQVLQQPKFAST